MSFQRTALLQTKDKLDITLIREGHLLATDHRFLFIVQVPEPEKPSSPNID